MSLQPYTAEESYQLMRCKLEADLSGEQSRMDRYMMMMIMTMMMKIMMMDRVWSNLYIGNKFAAEDAHYLALNKITHVLNMANTVSMIG